MLNDEIFGLFEKGNSVVHSLNPCTKILLACLNVVAIFMLKNVVSYLIILGIFILIFKLFKFSFKQVFMALKTITPFILFAVSFNVIFMFFSGRNLNLVEIKSDGLNVNFVFLNLVLLIILRIVILIFGFSFLTKTTLPTEITYAIEIFLKPLKFFKVRVNEIALILSISLRFVPVLFVEANRIITAQKVRGFNFKKANLKMKSQFFVTTIIALFISAFKRANDVAIAMQARCYRVSAKRTRFKSLKFGFKDCVFIVIGLSMLFLLILIDKKI